MLNAPRADGHFIELMTRKLLTSRPTMHNYVSVSTVASETKNANLDSIVRLFFVYLNKMYIIFWILEHYFGERANTAALLCSFKFWSSLSDFSQETASTYSLRLLPRSKHQTTWCRRGEHEENYILAYFCYGQFVFLFLCLLLRVFRSCSVWRLKRVQVISLPGETAWSLKCSLTEITHSLIHVKSPFDVHMYDKKNYTKCIPSCMN